MRLLNELGRALQEAGSMTWQITWSLILGFALPAVIQAVVRREAIARHLGASSTRTLALATGLGAASSSCSCAAVALARALVRRGAGFTAAMALEIASANLVIELGIILALLLSWQFTVAEFTGGPIMIVLMAVAFRLSVRKRAITAARAQAGKGLAGSMEGHAAMDMSISSGGGFWQRLISRDGCTSVSGIFVMEWAAVIRDITGGLLIAGAVAAWVPGSFWRQLFLTGHPLAAPLRGPVIGPVISLLSFACSIGSAPLAAVLRNGGLGLVPAQRAASVTGTGITWNYTTILNIIFLLVAAALVIRFIRSGSAPMLKMMGDSPDEHEQTRDHSEVLPHRGARPAQQSLQAQVSDHQDMIAVSSMGMAPAPTVRSKD